MEIQTLSQNVAQAIDKLTAKSTLSFFYISFSLQMRKEFIYQSLYLIVLR